MRHRLLVGLALLLAACSPMAGCGKGGGRAPCPAGKLCLEAGNSSDPETLDPDKMQLIVESTVYYDLMVGLTTFDARGNTIPGMATAWETSPDGLTWRFHLRKALWSDGAPVTAQDFVYNFQRLETPATASPYAYLFYLLQGARAVNDGKAAPGTIGAKALDDHTLELRLTHPAPDLPLLLVHSSAGPIPQHVVKRWGEAWVRPGHYVSNGPYTLAAWRLGDRLSLDRNPHYFGAAGVCFDRVDYFPVPDSVSAERQVASGQLDMHALFASNRIGYLDRKLPGYAHANPLLAIYYLALNPQVPALRDRRVRLALAMDIDREFLVGKLLRAGQSPLYGFTPPGIANYSQPPRPDWASWPFARRQAEARRLLAEAGYGPGRPLRLEMKYPNSGDRVIVPALQADWRAIGAEVSLAPEEGQIQYADLNARDFQIGLDSWYADFDDATTFLQLLSSSAGPQNHSDYANPRYDALLEAADHAVDLNHRARLLETAESVAMADWPVAPLYVSSGRNLVNPAITGFHENPLDWHPKAYFCRRGPAPRA